MLLISGRRAIASHLDGHVQRVQGGARDLCGDRASPGRVDESVVRLVVVERRRRHMRNHARLRIAAEAVL